MDKVVEPALRVIDVPPKAFPPSVTGVLTGLGLLAAIYAAATEPALGLQARAFMVAWLVASLALTVFVTPRHFTVGFLTGLATMLIGWRIAGLHGIAIVTYPLLAAFVAFALQFFACLREDRRSASPVLTEAGWLAVFIRIYVGLDLVPHFTEKLFAGPASFEADVAAFSGFGLTAPAVFVIVGGLCELGIAVGIGLGLLTRLAGLCAALYFLIATLLGGHFLNGFIWANPGGGWEYPVLMMVLFLAYGVAGAGAFSLDRALIVSKWMPRALVPLAVRPGRPGFG